MKITDNTNQKSETRTFKVGDVVKIQGNQNIALPFTLVLISNVGKGLYSPVIISNPDTFWQQPKQLEDGKFVFDLAEYTYTKVNAELIITD